MPWSRKQSRFLAADPQAVWDALVTPSLWPAFDADIQRFDPVGAPPLTGPGGPSRLTEGQRVRVIPSSRVMGPVHAATAPPATLARLQPLRVGGPAVPDDAASPADPASPARPGAATSASSRGKAPQPTTPGVLAWRQGQPGGYVEQTWTVESAQENGLPGTRLTRHTVARGPLATTLGRALATAVSGDLDLVAARLVQMTGTTAPAGQPLVIVAGGSGYIGHHLVHELMARGRDVVVLTRHPAPDRAYEQARWDGRTVTDWGELFNDPRGVDVVNLSGEAMAKRVTPARMATMRASRVDATRALVEASQRAAQPVRHWVQGSAVILRQDPVHPDDFTDEFSAQTDDAEAVPGMAALVRAWEDAVEGARADHLVTVRTTVVLGRDATELKALLALAAAGGGGPAGSGRQWMPWIALSDWIRVALAGLGMLDGVELPDGPVLAAAPDPVRNRDFMGALRHVAAAAGPVSGAPARFLAVPAPRPLVEAGTALLGFESGLALGGARAVSAVLPQTGFEFQHPTLWDALEAIYPQD